METIPIIVVDKPENVTLSKKPVVLRGINLGDCSQKWKDPDYLKFQISSDKMVTVHVCPTMNKLDFINKNFKYQVVDFHTLIDKCFAPNGTSETYYLRAIGENQRKDVALLTNDFPSIADDLKIPNLFPVDNLFSSVLRVSSNQTQLWTHYDIMDNILIQIVGRKKFVLFDPLDAPYLYLLGDKSQVLDVDNPDLDKFPLFDEAKKYVCVLEEGDILFIPALWFHNTLALTAGIAVNVFWKTLSDKFYDSKDLYGNRDLLPAQRSFQSMEKIFKNLDEMPEPYRKFYAYRLVENIKLKLNL